MDYNQLCLEVVSIAKKAGQFIMTKKNELESIDIHAKGLHDFVTTVDKEAERMIVADLSSLLPDATFLTEEGTIEQFDSEKMWIVDPLDGTTNFIHGVPCFSVSIALAIRNYPVLGVIYEPNLNECFYAWDKGGAYLNNSLIDVSETENLNSSLLATGFPYSDYKYLDEYMEFLKFTMRETRGLRRLGSAAVDLAWVACGRFDGFYEYGLRPWDVAAGICIVREAGGVVTDFQNSNNMLYGKELIASNKNIHKDLINHIQRFLKIGS